MILNIGDAGATGEFQTRTCKVARYYVRKKVEAKDAGEADWNPASESLGTPSGGDCFCSGKGIRLKPAQPRLGIGRRCRRPLYLLRPLQRLFQYLHLHLYPPARPRLPLYQISFRPRIHTLKKVARGCRRLRALKEIMTIQLIVSRKISADYGVARGAARSRRRRPAQAREMRLNANAIATWLTPWVLRKSGPEHVIAP